MMFWKEENTETVTIHKNDNESETQEYGDCNDVIVCRPLSLEHSQQ